MPEYGNEANWTWIVRHAPAIADFLTSDNGMLRTIRAMNGVERLIVARGLKTVAQLQAITDEDWLEQEHLGRLTLATLREAIPYKPRKRRHNSDTPKEK